jgi:ATP-dependent Clp protease ATP-binding subunit ClpX
MFTKTSFGVPQFYPRDLKKRVDDYVVGQDRAKKTICSTIFNHYQSLRRRHHQEHEDKNFRDKLQRQRVAKDRELLERYRDPHPAEGPRPDESAFPRHYTNSEYEDDFPGRSESTILHGGNTEGPVHTAADTFYIPEDTSTAPHVKIDKSNLLLIGPTGVGKTYILE